MEPEGLGVLAALVAKVVWEGTLALALEPEPEPEPEPDLERPRLDARAPTSLSPIERRVLKLVM